MTPVANNISSAVQRAPVSIFERLIPSLSFVIAAVSGAVGAMMIQKFFSTLRGSQTAGLDAFYIGLARVGAVMASVVAGAALLGGIALLVCLIRMFSKSERSSPPGIFLFLLGSLSLAPCLLVGIGIYLTILAASGPVAVGVTNVSWIVSILNIAAIFVSCLSILVLGAFSFISFSSQLGRKYSPFIFVLLIEIAMICTAAAFFSVVQFCLGNTQASFWG
ncbi:MAG: hypothetical protein ACRD43_05185 [Pyrinomonadaceae bacterium]